MDIYAPWRIDSELPWESAYSLFSKASWWQAVEPCDFLRRCTAGSLAQSRRGTRQVTFGMASFWRSNLQCREMLPITRQGDLLDSLIRAEADLDAGVGSIWQSHELRRCPLCIEKGVHLWIHQHTAVARCPVHLAPLLSTCTRCGNPMRQVYLLGQAPFSCVCGQSLLGKAGCRDVCALKEFACYPGIADDAHGWLALLNAQGMTVPGGGAWQLAHFARLCTVALHHCSIPECLRGERIRGVECRLKTVDVHDGALANVTGEDAEVAQSLWQALRETDRAGACDLRQADVSAGFCGQMEPLTDLVATAFRRVGMAHLATSSHHPCMDLPKLICGESLPQVDHPAFNELVHCCPVAVGFWLWRMVCGDLLSIIGRDPGGGWGSAFLKNPVGANAALFLFSRSQLHYCIQACALIIRQYRDGQIDAESAYYALSYVRGASGLWGTTGGSHATPLMANDRWLFASVDVTRLIGGKCTCVGPYLSRLKQFFAIRYSQEVADGYVDEIYARAGRNGHRSNGADPMSMMKCDRRIYTPVEVPAGDPRQNDRLAPLVQQGVPWLDVVITARGRRSQSPGGGSAMP